MGSKAEDKFFRTVHFKDSLRVLFNSEENIANSNTMFYVTRPTFWFENHFSQSFLLILFLACQCLVLSVLSSSIVSSVLWLVTCLCLYLLSVARSLKNHDRKKQECLIHMTLSFVLFLHFLCNCMKISLSCPIYISYIISVFSLPVCWQCTDFVRRNWIGSLLWAVIEKLPFVCNILNKCVVHNGLFLLPLCCQPKNQTTSIWWRDVYKKICISQNIRRYCNKF